MRQIGTLPSEEQARRFEDFLLSSDVKGMVEEEDGAWSIWVYEEDHFADAKEQLSEFRENPDEAKYTSVAKVAQKKRNVEEKENRRYRKRMVDVRKQWSRPLLARSRVTMTLIIVSIAVAVSSTDLHNKKGGFLIPVGNKVEPIQKLLFISDVEAIENGIRWDPTRGIEDILHGQIWRIFTPMFIHFSFLHILFNMMWLRDLGTSIEHNAGKWRYLLLVMTISGISNFAQFTMSGPFFGGMSGVVFGLFGFIWMRSKFDPNSGYYMPPRLVYFMIGFMFLCFFGMLGEIANTAHTVGLLTGMFFGYLPRFLRDLKRRA